MNGLILLIGSIVLFKWATEYPITYDWRDNVVAVLSFVSTVVFFIVLAHAAFGHFGELL